MAATARRSLSTRSAEAAPRLSASMPKLPQPENRSSTRASGTRSPRLEKIAPFTRSMEGRKSVRGIWSGMPPATPAITLTRAPGQVALLALDWKAKAPGPRVEREEGAAIRESLARTSVAGEAGEAGLAGSGVEGFFCACFSLSLSFSFFRLSFSFSSSLFFLSSSFFPKSFEQPTELDIEFVDDQSFHQVCLRSGGCAVYVEIDFLAAILIAWRKTSLTIGEVVLRLVRGRKLRVERDSFDRIGSCPLLRVGGPARARIN